MRGEAAGGGRSLAVPVVAATVMMALSLFAIAEVTAAFGHCAPVATRSGETGICGRGDRSDRRWKTNISTMTSSPSRTSLFCPLDRGSVLAARVAARSVATVVVPLMGTGMDEDDHRPVEAERRQPGGPIIGRGGVVGGGRIGGRMVKLRRRLRRVGGAALAALALVVGRTDSAEAAAAAVLQRVDKSPPPATTTTGDEAAGLREEIMTEVESATPDGEADLYEGSSSTTTSTPDTDGSTSDPATAPLRNRMTPEEFARLRRKDKSAPRLQKEPTDETARLKYRQKQRVAELARRQKQMAKANKSGRRMAVPLAGGFAALAVARHVVRSRREQNFVAQNIEKFETQKREFFNVTGKSESDDDLMESLRAAAATGNVTLDDDDDEDDDDDDDGGPPPPPTAPRRPPTGGGGGGGGGGPPPTPKSGSGGSSAAPPSASGGDEGGSGGDDGNDGGDRDGPASDEDVKRLDNLFKK